MSRGKPRPLLGILAAVASVLVIALGLGALLLRPFKAGKTMPEETRRSVQAYADRCSPRYPLEVRRVSEHEFIGSTWYEIELQAREDSRLRYTAERSSLSDLGGYPCLEFELRQLKIQRDGKTGQSTANRKLPKAIAEKYSLVYFDDDPAHVPPDADFTSHTPYPYPAEAQLRLVRRTERLGPDDGPNIQAALAAARDDGAVITELRYEIASATANAATHRFVLTAPALTSSSLQQDLERAENGEQVPGVTYAYR